MTANQTLNDVISRVFDLHRRRDTIALAWLATEAMEAISFPRSLHDLGYLGCHLPEVLYRSPSGFGSFISKRHRSDRISCGRR
jgi:hypothetical protein